MKTVTVWTLVTLAACVGTFPGCTSQRGDSIPLSEMARSELKAFWQTSLRLNEETHEKVAHLYREPGRIYAVTTDNRLLAVDAFSGHYLWSAQLPAEGLTASAVCQVGRVVFIAVLDELYGFSAMDGQRVLKKELKGAPTARPVVNGDYVYYGTHEGWFRAAGLFGLEGNWDRLTHAGLAAAPTFDVNNVYFANTDGGVYASVASKRLILWEYQTGGAVVADLKRTGQGLVLVASRDYVLHALNPVTGQPAWLATAGDPLEKTPHVAGGRVYVVKKGGELLALDETTGRTLWSADDIDEVIAASELTVFAKSRLGNVVVLSQSDGSVRYRLDPEDLALAAVNEVDGQLFVGSPKGEIVAIRETRVTYNDPVSAAAETTTDEAAGP